MPGGSRKLWMGCSAGSVEPLQLSARGMDDRTGIQTILDDVCNRRFDLLMIASMDRLSYDKEEVKAFLAEMDLNGISILTWVPTRSRWHRAGTSWPLSDR